MNKTTQTTHTPGPWGLSGNEHEISAYLPGRSPDDVASGQSYYVPIVKTAYAEWQGDSWLISEEEYKANARLIAAAPDMLQLLRMLVNNVTIDTSNYEALEAINTARDLLATLDVGND